MRRSLSLCCLWLGLLVLPATVFGSESLSKRPEWCKPGWECVPRAEMVADAEYHFNLREQLLKYKSRGSRLGFTIGPGLGVAAVVDENFGIHYVPAPGVYLVWGLRW